MHVKRHSFHAAGGLLSTGIEESACLNVLIIEDAVKLISSVP